MSLVLPADPPDADGSLRKIPFANLLIYLRERNLTGTVVFDPPPVPSAVPSAGPVALTVRRGTPVKASSHAPEARLSAVCLDLALVHAEKLAETWELAHDTKRLHGQVLLEYGVFDRNALLKALAIQLERKIAWLAGLEKDTAFRFFQGKDLLASYGGVEEPDVASARLVWVALRHAPPWAHIEKSMVKFATARLALSPTSDVSSFGLGEPEQNVVAALRERSQTLAELASRRLIEPSLLAPLVYGLLVTKQLELGRAEGANTELSTSGVTNVSSLFTPPSPSASSVAPLGMGGSAAISMPPPPPTLSAEHEEFRRELAERSRLASSQNFFAMLGIDQSTPKDTIDTVFFGLAKRWHPDKLPRELAPLRSEVASVFSMLSEAHATLTNDKKRENYIRLVADGGATLDDQALIRDVVDASTEFQKAEILLKRRDFSSSEEHAKRALALDPDSGDHIALIAHLEIQRTDEPLRLKELVADLDRAVAKNARSVKSLYYRALAYKKLGRTHDAMTDFRKVSELDPDHVDAAREVRLHQMRSSKPGGLESAGPAPKAGGFFGKLFKR